MATITKGKTFTNNEAVTPTKLNDLVDKATISNIVAADIATDAVTTAKILNLNVTTGKIADDAITDAKLADHATTDASRAVTTNHIRNLAITNAKLRNSTKCSVIGRSASTDGEPADIAATTDGHVLRRTSGTLAFGTIDSSVIATDAVTTAKILNLNVTTGKIADDAITDAKLADHATTDASRAVTTNHIRDLAVTTAKILDLNVTTAKLANDAVTADKLADHATTDASRAVTTNHIRDLAVTTGKLATTVQQALLPAGAVMPFAMNAAPSGWLAANGAAVSRTTYAALFSAIGTTYGIGDGSTTFTLPDLRGYFVRGSGTNSDGTTAGTFGAKQTAYAGFNKYEVSMDDGDDRTGPRGEVNGIEINDTTIVTFNDRSITKTKEIETIPGDTRPKNIALLYCIKF
jgi:hypothetical protein